MRRIGMILIAVVVVVALLFVVSAPVDAQCSMCRAVLTNSNDGQFIRNFNIGILVLLVPPVSIFCSIFILLRRHRGENDSNSE